MNRMWLRLSRVAKTVSRDETKGKKVNFIFNHENEFDPFRSCDGMTHLNLCLLLCVTKNDFIRSPVSLHYFTFSYGCVCPCVHLSTQVQMHRNLCLRLCFLSNPNNAHIIVTHSHACRAYDTMWIECWTISLYGTLRYAVNLFTIENCNCNFWRLSWLFAIAVQRRCIIFVR